ncbi:MAG: hypothetical protein J6C92_10720 [Bacteroidaceae bacterium]|nr:hypothetical protein [Bacteroidaceae bacterium]
MNNQELSAMIAEEVSKAVAPLYEQLEQIKSKRSEIKDGTEKPFEKGYFRKHYEKTGRIKKH